MPSKPKSSMRSGLEALIARERDAVVNGPEVDQVVADYLKNSHEFFDVRGTLFWLLL